MSSSPEPPQRDRGDEPAHAAMTSEPTSGVDPVAVALAAAPPRTDAPASPDERPLGPAPDGPPDDGLDRSGPAGRAKLPTRAPAPDRAPAHDPAHGPAH